MEFVHYFYVFLCCACVALFMFAYANLGLAGAIEDIQRKIMLQRRGYSSLVVSVLLFVVLVIAAPS